MCKNVDYKNSSVVSAMLFTMNGLTLKRTLIFHDILMKAFQMEVGLPAFFFKVNDEYK